MGNINKETPEERRQREAIEEIASNIAMMSRQVKALLGGRLKKETILILLSHSTKLPQYQVNQVLQALSDMERVHLK